MYYSVESAVLDSTFLQVARHEVFDIRVHLQLAVDTKSRFNADLTWFV